MDPKMAVTERGSHFDQFDPSWYDRHWSSAGPKLNPCHLWAARVVRKPLLDVGGGPGLLLDLLENSQDAVTVDFSPVAVEQCRRKGYEAAVVSAEAIPFPDASFHTVAAIEVLEHVDDLDVAVSELHRVARQQIIITVPPNMASVSHKRVWPLERWKEELGLGSPDFYDGVHVGWVVAPDPWRKAKRGKVLLEYDQTGPRIERYSAAHVTCRQNRRGLHIRSGDDAPASAHLLLAKGTCGALAPEHGIPAHQDDYYVGRITTKMPTGAAVRLFVIWYDPQGDRLRTDHVATLRGDSPTTAFSFGAVGGGSHFALALTMGSQPSDCVITLKSLTLKSVQIDEPYRTMLERVRAHEKVG